MPYLWFRNDGRAVCITQSARPVPMTSGRIEIPQSKFTAIGQRLDVYRVEGKVLYYLDEPVDLTPDVPTSVTCSQAKRALVMAGLYEAIETFVQAVEEEPLGSLYRIMWDAPEWFRYSPELLEVATQLGLTAEQVDDLFRLAGSL